MITIPINRYKPYDYIPLSTGVSRDQLRPANLFTATDYTTRKSKTTVQNPATKLIQPVLVFGEMEWLVYKIAQQELK